MKKQNINKIFFLIPVLILVTAACSAALSPDVAVGPETVDADQIAESVLAKVEAQLAEEVEMIRITNTEIAATSALDRDLEETLIDLYQQANPAVVFILLSNSSGSGFLIDDQGHIVTNNHVIENGSDYEVVFANGDRMRADLVGADTDSDLAVLKIDQVPTGVEPLPLASPDTIQVGQFVVAIGNPFGEQGSMSMGIISALGRSLPSQRVLASGSSYTLPKVIQTDAPINPGNSGGPLLNMEGEVVGVNAAIASGSRTNSGVGFSIPVNAVSQIIPALIENGSYDYPFMGVRFDGEISLDDQEFYDLPQTQGTYVVAVEEDSPADEAGLIQADSNSGQGGDLVIAIDGLDIKDFSDLNSYLVFETSVGQTIDITVIRDGETINIPLTLGNRP
jgi:2-alkenal reductase